MDAILMIEGFVGGMIDIKNSYSETKDIKELQSAIEAHAKKYKNSYSVGDYYLYTAELYMSDGDFDAGIAFVKTLVTCKIPVINNVLLNLRMAQYHIEAGETEKGTEYLIKLCTETVSNYEDSIKANELTEVWEKYKHLVEGKVPKSKSFMDDNPKSPEECTMHKDEIFDLPEDEILSALWDHLSEMSSDGECISCLNKWEKEFYYVFELCSEVNSGGFDSYLSYYGNHFEKAYKAFEDIGSSGMVKILDGVKSKFPKEKIPTKIESIQSSIEKLNSKGIDFEADDGEFYEKGEKELISKLLSFTLSNKERFR